LIRENKSIKVHVSEAGGDMTRGEKMPEDYVGGVVRVVEIEGVDSNPFVLLFAFSLDNSV
jgi:hypothetical protein